MLLVMFFVIPLKFAYGDEKAHGGEGVQPVDKVEWPRVEVGRNPWIIYDIHNAEHRKSHSQPELSIMELVPGKESAG